MRRLFTILFAAVVLSAGARQITPDEATTVALEFFNGSTPSRAADRISVTRVLPPSVATPSRATSDDPASPYYVFNADSSRGFVIISGDDHARKILGYSDTGSFNFTNLPPQLSAMLDQYSEQIATLSGSAADPSWSTPSRSDSDSDGGVLLETANWGQGAPYNSMCPEIDGVRCPTGCVATAMAIVMKYHNWPEKGRHSWEYTQAGKYNAVDFSKSEYRFTDFKNYYEIDAPQSDIVENLAKLIYDCGVAATTTYAVSESGANSEILGHVLMRFFKYSPKCQYLSKKFFSDEEWFNLIDQNIKDGYPVIYGARSTETGHQFVIDGVDNSMFHINWGWDGLLNGYFSLDGLTPDHYVFSENHSMILNIIPDESAGEYAEIWSNIGLFNDYNMAPGIGEDDGRGMEISCEDIVPGIPFSVITEYLSGPADFTGEIALAVIDNNSTIVDIVSKKRLERKIFPGEYYPYVNQVDAHKWKDVVFNGEILDGYRLQLVAKRDTDSDWLPVNSTMQSPSSLPIKGNIPTVIKEVINYHCSDDERMDIDYTSHMIRMGQNSSPDLLCRNGVAHLYINNKYIGTANDHYRVGIGYYPKSTNVNTDIYYSKYENLKSKLIDIQVPGTLNKLLADSDTLDVFELKITGKINNDDLTMINKMHSLGALDMSEVEIIGNKLNTSFKPLQILKLPSKLTHIDSDTDQKVLIVDIPETVENCGRLVGSDYIKFNSATPPGVSDDFNPQLKYTTVFVPSGTKDNYAVHPIWGNAREIIECDEPIKASWNFPYLHITDSFCALSTGYTYSDAGLVSFPPVPWEEDPIYPGRYYIIPSEIIKEGVKRQVSFIKDIRPSVVFNSAGETYFQGRNIYFLPENGFLKATSTLYYSGEYPMQYAVTPRLTANFTGISGEFLVPAHSLIGNGDELDELNSICSRIEMFSLEKDSSTNLIAIKPNFKGVRINDIIINGSIVKPIEDLSTGYNLYKTDFSKENSVTIGYEVFGVHSLTTNYSHDVLASIPESELKSGIYDFEIVSDVIDEVVEVYNLNGVLVMKISDKTQLNKLEPGVYVLRQGGKATKFVVK